MPPAGRRLGSGTSARSCRTSSRRSARCSGESSASGNGASPTYAYASAKASFIDSIWECRLRLEPLVDAERQERRRALPVRRQLADLDSAVVESQRLDPLGLRAPRDRPRRASKPTRSPRRPARSRTRPGPSSAIRRSVRAELGQRVPPADPRRRPRRPRAPAPTCRRSAPCTRARARRGRPPERAPRRARGGRSAPRGRPTPARRRAR